MDINNNQEIVKNQEAFIYCDKCDKELGTVYVDENGHYEDKYLLRVPVIEKSEDSKTGFSLNIHNIDLCPTCKIKFLSAIGSVALNSLEDIYKEFGVIENK